MNNDLWEREAERAALVAAMASAARGQGTATFFLAQPGLGKTRLLAVAAEVAGDRFTAVRATGQEMEASYPFGMVHQMVSDLGRGWSARLIATEPVLRAFARGQRRGGRTELTYALFWLLGSVAERRPLLLLLDDLHWSDPDSLEFWRFLAARAQTQPMALVVGLRPWPAAAADMAERLAAGDRAAVLGLRPLGPEGTLALLADTLGAAPNPALVRQAMDVTGGNPLLVREMGGLVRTGGRLGNGRDLLRIRLQGLPQASLDLLGAAAVTGVEMDVPFLLALAGVGAARADAALHPLTALGVLMPVPGSARLAFSHQLLRQVAEEMLSPAKRLDLHRRVLGMLRAAGAPAAAMVPHALAVATPGDPDGIALLTAAAADAHGQAAYETAAAHLRQALALQPAGAVRATILYDLGRAEQRAGDFAAAHAAFGEAAAGAGCPPDLHARIRRSWALSLTMAGRTGEARSQLELAVASAVDGGGPGLAAEILVAHAVLDMTTGMIAEGQAAAARALQLAERARDPAAVARSVAVGSNLAFLAGEPHAYERVREAAALLPAAAPDEIETFWGWSVPTAVAMIAMRSERYAEAEALFAEMASAAGGRRARYATVWAGSFRAELAWRRGRFREALREVEEATRLPAEVPWATALAPAVRGRILIDLGQIDEAEATLRRAESDALAAQLGPALLWARAARAALSARRGDHAAAAEALLAGIGRAAAIGVRDPGMLPWHLDAAEVCMRCGRSEDAARLAADALDQARAFGRRGLEAAALRTQGLLAADAGRDEQAESAFAAALATQTELGLGFERGRTLLALGSSLRRRGTLRRARAILAEAEDELAACGAELWRRDAEAEQLAAGGQLRRQADPLTPQERRIAELVAQGRTNRQIAALLLVSPKTLETHLRHIYAKMGLDSRVALQEKIRGGA